MKKLLVGAFLWIFALTGVAVLPNYTHAQDGTDWANPNANTNEIGDGSQTLTWSALLDTIKNAINWILWILATIALVICLYGWFKMITSAWDENKYKSGLSVLKNAAIGLAIIWLSWMIVSVIFWFVWTLWWGKQTQGWATNNADAWEGSITAWQWWVGEVNWWSNNWWTNNWWGRAAQQTIQPAWWGRVAQQTIQPAN